MKYIIFRYDRIGDFLISSILLNNIKNQDNNIKFTLVCSEKNYSYAKNSFLVDDILLIPNNFFKRIKFYFQIFRSKFNKAIVLDGKKKSILSALLIKCDQKILLTNKNFYQIIFSPFFNKIFYSKKNTNKIDELISISKYLQFKFNTSSCKYKNIKSNQDQSTLEIIKKTQNFNIFHFDEKWIFDHYIKTYANIEPTESELIKFIQKLSSNKKKDLIITTGISENKLIFFLKSKFNKIGNNIFEYKCEHNSIFLIENLDIFNLEYLISKSESVITCHGATSHLANMYDKNLIDIIDNSEVELFKNWTHHFTNYTSLNREFFSILSENIIKKI